MIVPVKFLVNRCVLNSEICAKIDNARAGGQKRFGKFGRKAVRQCQENKTGLTRNLFRVGIGKLERGRNCLMREAWKNLRERFARQLPRKDRHADALGAGAPVLRRCNRKRQPPRPSFSSQRAMRIPSRADCNEKLQPSPSGRRDAGCRQTRRCASHSEAATVSPWSFLLLSSASRCSLFSVSSSRSFFSIFSGFVCARASP